TTLSRSIDCHVARCAAQRSYRRLNACHSPTADDASTPFLSVQLVERKLTIWLGRPADCPPTQVYADRCAVENGGRRWPQTACLSRFRSIGHLVPCWAAKRRRPAWGGILSGEPNGVETSGRKNGPAA